ncbi:MAG TPA: metalloregulator ArsR/SmtB family transcription factor [Steroidobacteraceae bacterium]|jgi:DNA-binding transcriptional ArsR family regulator|nr:metalloregulator ArsR/SmtB family transcription factor [Steroidobacteraceae bacterium]
MPNLDVAFSALADPTRRAILARLALGEATVMEIAEPFDMTQPAVSRHLKVLEGAGLIVRRVEGTKRPCRLAPAAITEVDQWLDMLRQALAKNYDRLDDVLAGMKPKKRKVRR